MYKFCIFLYIDVRLGACTSDWRLDVSTEGLDGDYGFASVASVYEFVDCLVRDM